MWANQRATQHTPVQRPQVSQTNVPGSNHSPHSGQHAQNHIQQTLDDAFFPTNATNAIDDYRHGGPGGVGQLSSSAQPQPGSIEEFPPLNRIGPGEIGQDRRVNMMQNAASGGYASASGFAPGIFVHILYPSKLNFRDQAVLELRATLFAKAKTEMFVTCTE